MASGRVRLLGLGLALPGPAISTEVLCERLELRFHVPARRFGRHLARRLQVHTRHLCRDFERAVEGPRPGHRNPELATLAVERALSQAGVAPWQLGYLLSHTATPAQALPPGSAEIARLLGAPGPHAEFRQACTGFANALQFACALLREPGAAPIAIVGSETGSVYFDPERLAEDPAQWVNCLQMGDGAAAVVLGPDDAAPGPRLECAYFGQIADPPSSGLWLSAGGSDHPGSGDVPHFGHDFDAVARHGAALFGAGRDCLAAHGRLLSDARVVIPHQASGMVADGVAAHFGLRRERVSDHGQRVGNLGSASIWAALCDVYPTLLPGDSALVLGAEATQYSFGGFALIR
jgi:3-oxoacyl-[acyl-carrier-protein] synthase-3